MPTEPSERSIGIAARVWCDQDMRDVIMDVEAARKIAAILDEVIATHTWHNVDKQEIRTFKRGPLYRLTLDDLRPVDETLFIKLSGPKPEEPTCNEFAEINSLLDQIINQKPAEAVDNPPDMQAPKKINFREFL